MSEHDMLFADMLAGNAPQLDAATASKMLEGVFEQCDVEPNTVPMEALASYTLYRKERFGLQRGVVVATLALFLMLPLLFVAPRVAVSREGMGERGLPEYSIEVEGVVPIKSVRAVVGSYALPVYEADARSFTVEPTRNGTLAVEVTLLNNQRCQITADVSEVDATAPVLVGNEVDATSVYLYFSDDGIGIDFASIYGLTASHEVVRPTRIDEALGLVVFDFPTEDTDVYVSDRIDNTLHLSMALHS